MDLKSFWNEVDYNNCDKTDSPDHFTYHSWRDLDLKSHRLRSCPAGVGFIKGSD